MLVATNPVALTRARRAAVRDRLVSERKAVKGEPARGLPRLEELPIPELGVARVVLPAPLRVELEVIGGKAADAAPLSKATVRNVLEHGAGARRAVEVALASADAEGRMSLFVPLALDSWGRALSYSALRIHVAAPGYARTAVSPTGSLLTTSSAATRRAIAEAARTLRVPKLVVRLKRGVVQRRRILGRDGQPLVGASVYTRVALRAEQGGAELMITTPLLLRSGADGFVEFPEVEARDRQHLLAALVLPRDVLAVGEGAATTARLPLLRALPWKLDTAAKSFDLRELRFITLALSLPDGSPARACKVSLFDGAERDLNELFPSPGRLHDGVQNVVSDRRGRCVVPVFAGRTPRVVATSDAHYCVQQIDLAPKASTQRLRMLAFRVAKGRVVDSAGGPVHGAKVYVASSSSAIGDDGDAQLLETLNFMRMNAVTDATGHFRVMYVPIKRVRYMLAASVVRSGRAFTSNAEVDVEAPGGVQFEIPGLAPKVPPKAQPRAAPKAARKKGAGPCP